MIKNFKNSTSNFDKIIAVSPACILKLNSVSNLNPNFTRLSRIKATQRSEHPYMETFTF